MALDRYVAYVGSYTRGKAKGITICDVDVEKGIFTKRKEIEVKNASYIKLSNSGEFLYSVSDQGISAFKILEDGDLLFLNTGQINGLRPCHITIDKSDRYVFAAGYHDGKASIVKINEDGSVGKLTSEVFHKGMGSIAERNFRPHITCARLTPEGKYLMACDMGIDQVKIYDFNYKTGKIKLIDILRCQLESAPRSVVFSPDGRFAYIISQLKNAVAVFSYTYKKGAPEFNMIQQISTLGKVFNDKSAVASIKFSPDGNYIFCTNAGDNSFAFFERDIETGLLTKRSVLPISGDYPKQVCVFPDGKHLASLNHESGQLTFFKIYYEKGIIVMNGAPLDISEPNCAVIKKL